MRMKCCIMFNNDFKINIEYSDCDIYVLRFDCSIPVSNLLADLQAQYEPWKRY